MNTRTSKKAEQNLSSKLVFKPSSECILSFLIPVSLVSRTKINPICRSDLTQSLYSLVYSLRSSVFFLSTSGFSDYSVFLFNIQRILKHDFFPRALFCRLALLKHVLVPTAVSTTRRARSPCDVEGSLDKPVYLDNQHLSQPHLIGDRSMVRFAVRL